MKDWFMQNPVLMSLGILLVLSVGSCTFRKIYCEWANCSTTKP